MKQNMEKAVHDKLIKNYEKYYRLAYSYVHNESDALDVVQESAYKAILKCDSLKNESYADTWIYRIVINTALDAIRKSSREQLGIEEDFASVNDTYDEYDLKTAINRLEPLDRSIVVLRFFEDLKLEQIADITNENVNTVKSRLYRTLKKLRVQLSE